MSKKKQKQKKYHGQSIFCALNALKCKQMYSTMEKQLRTSLEVVLLSVLGTALPWQTRWHSPRCWLCCFLLPTPGKLPLWLLPVCLECHHMDRIWRKYLCVWQGDLQPRRSQFCPPYLLQDFGSRARQCPWFIQPVMAAFSTNPSLLYVVIFFLLFCLSLSGKPRLKISWKHF